MTNFDVDKYIEKTFKDHKATLTDFGKVKILDFQKEKLFECRIRFLFDEEYCRLYISGDFGELVALNYNNMKYETFENSFCNENVGYFADKIECMTHEKYVYDPKEARKDLIERLFDEREIGREEEDFSEEEKEVLEEIMSLFSDEFGFNHTNMYENTPYSLVEMDCDYWEWIGKCGRHLSPYIELYLKLFKLAKNKLKEVE